MQLRRLLEKAIVLVGIAALGSCASTSVSDTWKDPAAGPIAFTKIVAVAFTEDDALRREAEDQIVTHIRSAPSVQSYKFLTVEELRDTGRAKQRLAAEGFDGAVAMRLVGVTEAQNVAPGSYPGSYYSFWNYSDSVMTPRGGGAVAPDTEVHVETLLYSLKTDKLIWGGSTKTMNPDSVRGLIDNVAASVSQELRKEGLIR
jgi:hypothetical protein